MKPGLDESIPYMMKRIPDNHTPVLTTFFKSYIILSTLNFILLY